MREADNIRAVEALGVDMIGFIFWPHSSRYVSQPPSYLPKQAKRVGVFVNEDPERIRQVADQYQLHFVQLHGDETPDQCQTLRSLLKEGTRLIKMIQIESAQGLDRTQQYEGKVDYFLFETKCQGYGGSGKQFDWDILQAYKGNTPFLLSGGIGPDDAERLKTLSSQLSAVNCIGIDLNSRFETKPAVKDIQLLRQFIEQLRSHFQAIGR